MQGEDLSELVKWHNRGMLYSRLCGKVKEQSCVTSIVADMVRS